MAKELKFDLHPAQFEVFNDPARFKLVVAGRRFGKSWLAAALCLLHGLEDKNKYGYDVSSSDTYVYYVAPTFEQAKKAVWNKLKELGSDVIVNINQNQGIFELVNGRRIYLCGADRPDTLRGAKLSFVVLDEYASMKPDVWDEVITPALADVVGEALIIGTPDGKNHFYDLYTHAKKVREEDNEAGVDEPEWATFMFRSVDNPTIPIEREMQNAARRGTPEEVIRQEYMASFHASGGRVFSIDDLQYTDEEPPEGSWYIAVDPAGFENVEKARGSKARLDETAIACVKVGEFGWYVGDIRHGRWDIRRTSVEIIKAAKDYQALAVGIEQGALKNAIMPYLDDQQKRIGAFINIQPVTHGGKRKVDRIVWALQGRLQHGRLLLPVQDEDNREWQRHFVNQLLDFPNPLSHDDLLDALAYIDQVAEISYHLDDIIEEGWEPLDEASGY